MMESLRMNRRQFLHSAALGSLACLGAGRVAASIDSRELTAAIGDGSLSVLSDGHLQLPASFLHPQGIDDAELDDLLSRYQLTGAAYEPDCNISLWQQGDRIVLFDVGAGSQFMSTAGRLPMALEAAGIEPGSVTDVLLTHAHPDHLWGLLDDFDDLQFPNASVRIHRGELDYWLDGDTLGATPEARQSFVVGAQSRLGRASEQIATFEWGEEVLPGIEAIDTQGHTPGHTSFALHHGGDSVLIVGDALNNVALSFEYPTLPSPADQDPALAGRTRTSLLDRMATDQMRLIGFHLPTPGFGRVQRNPAGAYRFVAEEAQ
ncbi:MAG: MBL fold metallo-hydrolase [Granulosicoccus sp.]|nr:MBL fold metallo-hydrolase [Granulosicoccus sp.]